MTRVEQGHPATAPWTSADRVRRRPESAWSDSFRRRLLLLGIAVVTLWLIGLIAFSALLFHRMDLTADFASYFQAWSLIGSGHINPLDTVWLDHVPFVKNDFELIIWPLSLLHIIDPGGFVLLLLQDIAVAATGLISYQWIIEYLEERRVSPRVALAVGVSVLIVIVANPGVYQTLLFDFHIEPFSTVFIVSAGRCLWMGRYRRAWIWVAAALLCGSFAAITIIGLGLSAVLAGRASRRTGGLLILAGLGWLGLIDLIGANAGSALQYYAYLAGRSSLPAGSGLLLVAAGIVTHPQRVFTQLHLRMHYIWTLIRPVGIVGLASAWGFGVPFVVLLVDALNSQYGFIFQAFQNFAVFPFVLVGTVMVLVSMAKWLNWTSVLAVVLGLALLGSIVAYGETTSPGDVRWASAQVGPAQAFQLRRALAMTPPSAEVVATIGIMGRFAGRQSVYFFSPHRIVPVERRTIVFVFDPANENTIPNVSPADDIAASNFVRDVLHARVLIDESGITAFAWSPPHATTHLTFPPTPVPG